MRARAHKPHSAYRNSGVEWLGEIPAGWEVKRLRFVSDSNPVPSEVRNLPSDSEVSFVPMEAVGKNGGLALETTKLLADVKAGYSYFRDGDVVIAKITPCFENGKGALADGLTNGIAFGTTELHVLRARHSADRRFAFYVTLSDAFRRLGEADMYGAGGQKRISESFVRNFPIALPSLPEQRAIATFLDRETARIDALVAKKERLITLLQERRTALITSAVTKGLDPAAPMKDSGVEWLGEIPAHWRAERIMWAAQMVSGHTPDKKIDSYWVNGTVPWVSLADTSQLRKVDYLQETSVMTTADGISNSSAHVLPTGTVVFSRDASIGLCAIIARPMAVSQHFIGWICGPTLVPEYLLLVLRAMTPELERRTMGATVKTIGMPDVRTLSIPMPPVVEQRELVRSANQHADRTDELVRAAKRAVGYLHELRTALISAAVTGKIDVRDHESSGERQQ